jgi:hypothetical protein
LHYKDIERFGKDNKSGFIKHIFLNTLLSYKKKFGEKFGEIVLASDSRKYWRKEVYPAYKGHRERLREASDVDWKLVFEVINSLKTDIKENFRFKMLEVEGAEADDIIAVLCEWSQENELVQDGLFDSEPQPILIVSSDGDFLSLQKYKNVNQWSPLINKYVKPKTNAQKHLIEKIVRGDGGDNIPNVFTDESWSTARMKGESVRAKNVKAERLEEFLDKGFDACINDTERSHYQRNKLLIDFESIPLALKEKILSEYENYQVKGSTNKIMNYLIQNRLKNLIQEVGSF